MPSRQSRVRDLLTLCPILPGRFTTIWRRAGHPRRQGPQVARLVLGSRHHRGVSNRDVAEHRHTNRRPTAPARGRHRELPCAGSAGRGRLRDRRRGQHAGGQHARPGRRLCRRAAALGARGHARRLGGTQRGRARGARRICCLSGRRRGGLTRLGCGAAGPRSPRRGRRVRTDPGRVRGAAGERAGGHAPVHAPARGDRRCRRQRLARLSRHRQFPV